MFSDHRALDLEAPKVVAIASGFQLNPGASQIRCG